ncbi:flavin-containing monooxygenase [Paenisporosarcina sp.]|uniref:flavin-containing monooxygenase n=1 Tax=Paenisporosarcina sp. TaxID=1932001 RepID=UPI003C743FC8
MFHTIVVGAGQAGLAMSYFLMKNKKDFLVLDKGLSIGESWSSRYDSLVLFTPRLYNSLPGMAMEGNLHGLPSKDEVSCYLSRYAQAYQFPIQFNTEVQMVVQNDDYSFTLTSDNGVYQTRNIVIATGPFHTKFVPPISKSIDHRVIQLHSSEFRNQNQLQEGNVLVVGGGNSGAQIAVELSESKKTYLAVSKKPDYMPLMVMGKSIFYWFDKLGILNATSHSKLGQFIRKKGDPIFGQDLKIVLKQNRIVMKPRVIECRDNVVMFDDTSTLPVQNIIWSTGFKSDYSWVQINGIVDGKNEVIHQRGVSPVKGVYFIGLPWQSKRGSALLQGVGDDAEFLMTYLND